MIRVLQCVNNMHRAGLETMLMNYYRNIDRTKIQFDFLTHRPQRDDYDDEIESLGGKIYRAPRLYPQNYPAYFSYMKKFFASHPEYKIVHSHIDAMSYLPLLTAKRAGVPVRIAHSHNTSIDLDFKYPLKRYFRAQINGVANYRLACGERAGEFLFGGKDFSVIPNAIDTGKFCFNPEISIAKKRELNLEGKFVVGHIGRFSYQKNHKFLIKIFSEILKREKNAVLLLVGNGEKEDLIKRQVSELGISEQVLFLANRSDVNELYGAMDVFVLPSHFEGIPVVGIEAQFSGLACVFSDKVPNEVAFTDNCSFVSLDASAGSWAEQILSFKNFERASIDNSNSLYDIKNAHIILEKYYTDLYEKLIAEGKA
ncbi:MAG: glycosyltransferase family 1 protein [Oscillospiraceae bacterium]|nr:glycosyltransferase family 1 protein [Oscillospiraceae bacterium]